MNELDFLKQEFLKDSNPFCVFHGDNEINRAANIFQNQFDTLFSKNNMTHLSDESTSLTVGTLKDKLANQALLISNIEIFRILFAIGFTVVIVLIIYKLYRFFITKKYTT